MVFIMLILLEFLFVAFCVWLLRTRDKAEKETHDYFERRYDGNLTALTRRVFALERTVSELRQVQPEKQLARAKAPAVTVSQPRRTETPVAARPGALCPGASLTQVLGGNLSTALRIAFYTGQITQNRVSFSRSI